MKRTMFLFLAVLTTGMVFAAGNRAGSGGAVAAGSGRRYTSLPFATDGRTRVSMLIPVAVSGNLTSYDYADNSYTREVVDRTGVQIDFISVPTADYGTRRNLLLSSGDYPEALAKPGFSFSDLAYWAQEGVFIPLDDYHYLEYPIIAKVFNDYPALNTVTRLADGKVYALP